MLTNILNCCFTIVKFCVALLLFFDNRIGVNMDTQSSTVVNDKHNANESVTKVLSTCLKFLQVCKCAIHQPLKHTGENQFSRSDKTNGLLTGESDGP